MSGLLTNPLTGGAGARLLDQLELAPGMRVLDVGCGPGRLSVPAAERVAPGGRVVALDLQAAMLAKLSKRATARGVQNIVTLQAPIESATLEPESFDRALLAWVLGEIPDRAAALQKIFASLKPGGVLSVTETLTDPHYQRLSTVLQLAEAAGFQRGQYYRGWLGYTLHLAKPSHATQRPLPDSKGRL